MVRNLGFLGRDPIASGAKEGKEPGCKQGGPALAAGIPRGNLTQEEDRDQTRHDLRGLDDQAQQRSSSEWTLRKPCRKGLEAGGDTQPARSAHPSADCSR